MYQGPSKERRLSQKRQKYPNLIPLMNMFIVIIPMMMMIMVSVHLALVGINLPVAEGGGGSEIEQKEEAELPKKITLALLTDRFQISIEGIKDIIEIPALSENAGKIKYDFLSLDQNINHLKKENENQNTIEILPDPQVQFDILLRSIDICKSNGFPNIKYLTVSKKYYQAKP
ncbi:MAG TPA: hypothetical protein ENL20_00990 [Candidatus Cloacimonetes bacterium]|nr:hypothetical protein [Candidatus Cloacimonadota bacterium]